METVNHQQRISALEGRITVLELCLRDFLAADTAADAALAKKRAGLVKRLEKRLASGRSQFGDPKKKPR
jgi:hypothetical protein